MTSASTSEAWARARHRGAAACGPRALRGAPQSPRSTGLDAADHTPRALPATGVRAVNQIQSHNDNIKVEKKGTGMYFRLPAAHREEPSPPPKTPNPMHSYPAPNPNNPNDPQTPGGGSAPGQIE